MKRTDSMKDAILVKKLKAEDSIELPMDEMFFENMHDKIMSAVEKTNIKPLNKWTKTWVFLEQKTLRPSAKIKKVIRLGIAATSLMVTVKLLDTIVSHQNQDDTDINVLS